MRYEIENTIIQYILDNGTPIGENFDDYLTVKLDDYELDYEVQSKELSIWRLFDDGATTLMQHITFELLDKLEQMIQLINLTSKLNADLIDKPIAKKIKI